MSSEFWNQKMGRRKFVRGGLGTIGKSAIILSGVTGVAGVLWAGKMQDEERERKIENENFEFIRKDPAAISLYFELEKFFENSESSKELVAKTIMYKDAEIRPKISWAGEFVTKVKPKGTINPIVSRSLIEEYTKSGYDYQLFENFAQINSYRDKLAINISRDENFFEVYSGDKDLKSLVVSVDRILNIYKKIN